MDIYKFDLTLAEYLEESTDVLCCTGSLVTPQQVQSQWAAYTELILEPAGWNAFWKISRLYCEEFQIKYPTVVFGTVQQVIFDELKAIFTINLVEDESIHLPEQYEVPLIDLWISKNQENSALNIIDSAKCIDLLRFFYKNIWMPWDYECDNDYDWPEKHLESRIQFYYDLKKEIRPTLVSHIRKLLTEADYLHQQKENLETDLEDDEDVNDTTNKQQITKLMRLHLRMSIIKNEIELLENPETRHVFDEMNVERLSSFGGAENLSNSILPTKSEPTSYFVIQSINTIDKHQEYLKKIKSQIEDDKKMFQMHTKLQDCLETNNLFKEIFIPSGIHSIKYVDYFIGNSSICGIKIVDNNNSSTESDIIIQSAEEDSALLMLNGDFKLENVTLDCRKVRTGILLRKGCLTLKNCTLIGDEKSCTTVGCVALDGTSLIIIDCIIKNFATAINCHPKVNAQLTRTIIQNAITGIECTSDPSVTITFEQCKMDAIKRYGIMIQKYNSTGTNAKQNYTTIANYLKAENNESNIRGDCEFSDNNHNGNIVVYYRKVFSFMDIFTGMDIDDSIMKINGPDESVITIESDSTAAIEIDDDSSFYESGQD